MKKRFISLLVVLALALSVAATAAAKQSTIEELEYKGFGVIKAELERDADWLNDADIILTDADGNVLDWIFIGGDEEEIYLRSKDISDGAAYTLQFKLGDVDQSVEFESITGIKYRIDATGGAAFREEKEKCDFCRERGHDEDYCPERINAAELPEDADSLARIFDIDRCDRCNGMGHDDDRCPNR